MLSDDHFCAAVDACVIAQRSQNEVCFLGGGESIAAEGFGDGVDYYPAGCGNSAGAMTRWS